MQLSEGVQSVAAPAGRAVAAASASGARLLLLLSDGGAQLLALGARLLGALRALVLHHSSARWPSAIQRRTKAWMSTSWKPGELYATQHACLK